MGPMLKGEKLNKRKVTKLGILGLAAMFAWSLIAAPASIGQEEPAPEPEEVLAYSTFAEAAPVSNYLDHKSPVPAPAFGIALAHSQTEVNQPSQASGLAWLADFGIANGLHGTTTGASVPTEATARQPGGVAAAEFKAAGGPVGEEEFGRVAAGWARATATQVGSPRGFAHSFIANAVLFPAAGTPPEAPGTYDPDGTFPGGPQLAPTPDPGPRNQMAILAAGSIASTSESVRTGDTVTSIGVAEIQGLNIGNRTSDGRCTNCFVIDAIRVETYATTNGKGSRAAYRVMLGRACRRTLVTTPTPVVGEADETLPREEDQCLQPGDPRSPYTFDGSDERIAQFNEFFKAPIVIPGATCPGSDAPCTIAIRITAGLPGHADPKRPERTVNPPDGACRNYAYPDPEAEGPVEDCQALPEHIRPATGPDKDNGQVAQAVAEGIDIEILTLTGTQLIPTNDQLDQCFGAFGVVPPPELPEGTPSEVGLVTGLVSGCPISGLRQVRELNVTLGVSQAAAIARPNIVTPPTDGGLGGGDGLGGVIPPPIGDGGLGGIVPPAPSGGGQTVVGGGGLGAGAYRLKIDWSSFKIKPLPAGDLAKAVLAGGIVGGMVLLIRRRLRFAQG